MPSKTLIAGSPPWLTQKVLFDLFRPRYLRLAGLLILLQMTMQQPREIAKILAAEIIQPLIIDPLLGYCSLKL